MRLEKNITVTVPKGEYFLRIYFLKGQKCIRICLVLSARHLGESKDKNSIFLPSRSLQYMTNSYGMCSVKQQSMNPENKGADNCYGNSKEKEFSSSGRIKNDFVELLLSLRT